MKILLALAATLLAGATVGFSVALPTVRHSVEQRLMVRDMQNVVTASSVSCLPSVDFGDKEGADSSLSDILSAFPYVMEGWIALPNEDLFAYYARDKSRAAKPKRKDVPADGVHMEPNAIIACGAIAQKPESRVGTLCISGSPQGFRSFD
jgi:hypothetical protein